MRATTACCGAAFAVRSLIVITMLFAYSPTSAFVGQPRFGICCWSHIQLERGSTESIIGRICVQYSLSTAVVQLWLGFSGAPRKVARRSEIAINM